jgi:hypothetical protein
MATAPGQQFPRQLKQLTTARQAARPNHIGPGRAHMRSQAEEFKMEVTPEASFPRKLNAFLSIKVFGWISSYLKFRFGQKHQFQSYAGLGEDGVYQLATGQPEANEEIRVSLAGDWATGTLESNSVAKLIRDFDPHFTIHLGDVYYVGDGDEVNENCLGKSPANSSALGVTWPVGSVGAFALNGNHEMYANGDAYFDSFLPALGVRPSPNAPPGNQKASFFCLQNDFWNVIAIDTGYNSIGLPILERLPFFKPNCKLQDELLDWLRQTVQPKKDKRGIVVLGHHQYYSAFEDMFKKPARQLAEFIDRPVLWFWGHEHRMAIYGKRKFDDGIEAYGRCIGHGGMPVDIHKKIQHGECPLVLYDDRQYESLDGIPVGMNGFVNLTFRGNSLTADYRDLRNNQLLTERWEVVDGQLVGKEIQRLNADLTQVADLNIAIGGAG